MNHFFGNYIPDLGLIKMGTRASVAFTQNPDTPPIKYVAADCGCTDVSIGEKTVSLEYQAPKVIPEYIRQTGQTQWTVSKGATVTYIDGTTEYLQFTATVTI